MGFLDSISNTINRGTSAAERGARTMKLNGQSNDLLKQRRDLAAQLGASLYEVTKDDAALRSGRESLYDGIASIDTQRADIQAQIASIEAEAAAEAAAAQTYRCPQCGTTVGANDLFCSGCGKPIAEIRQAAGTPAPVATGRVCAKCGAAIGADDRFCMGCGAPVEPAAAPETPAEPAPETPAEPAPVEGDVAVPEADSGEDAARS